MKRFLKRFLPILILLLGVGGGLWKYMGEVPKDGSNEAPSSFWSWDEKEAGTSTGPRPKSQGDDPIQFPSGSQLEQALTPEFKEGEVSAALNKDLIDVTDTQALESFAAKHGLKVKDIIKFDNSVLFGFDPTTHQDIEAVQAALEADEAVEYAIKEVYAQPSALPPVNGHMHGFFRNASKTEEVGSIFQQLTASTVGSGGGSASKGTTTVSSLESTPTNVIDPSQLWPFHNPGGPGAKEDADTDAIEAWEFLAEKKFGADEEIIVAVIDSGFFTDHEAFEGIKWDGSKKCVDYNNETIPLGCPNHGWSFDAGRFGGSEGSAPDIPAKLHGTFTASIVAGKNIGIGQKSKIKLMFLRSDYSPTSIKKAILFAQHNGAKVINASFGGYDKSLEKALKSTLKDFPGLFVAAAGNEGVNNDKQHHYPSDIDVDGVISVMLTNKQDDFTFPDGDYANYGAKSVDLGAPGSEITGASSVAEYYKESFETKKPTPAKVEGGMREDGGWYIRKRFDGASHYVALGHLNSDKTELKAKLKTDQKEYTLTSPPVDLSKADKGTKALFWVGFSQNNTGTLHFEMSDDGGTSFKTLETFNRDFFKALDKSKVLNAGGISFYQHTTDALAKKFRKDLVFYRFRYTNPKKDIFTFVGVDDVMFFSQEDTGGGSGYITANGSSAASPMVAGAVATLWSYSPALSPEQVKSVILESGDEAPELKGKNVSGKRLNLHSALKKLNPPVIEKIILPEFLRASDRDQSSGKWTIPFAIKASDPDNIGEAGLSHYEIIIKEGLPGKEKIKVIAKGKFKGKTPTETAEGKVRVPALGGVNAKSVKLGFRVYDKDGQPNNAKADELDIANHFEGVDKEGKPVFLFGSIAQIQPAVCGDGYIEGGEECEYFGTTLPEGCGDKGTANACKFVPVANAACQVPTGLEALFSGGQLAFVTKDSKHLTNKVCEQWTRVVDIQERIKSDGGCEKWQFQHTPSLLFQTLSGLSAADPSTIENCSYLCQADGQIFLESEGRCAKAPECGDGLITAPEQCDDGNTTDDGNGCSATCRFEVFETECEAPFKDPKSFTWADGGDKTNQTCQFWGDPELKADGTAKAPITECVEKGPFEHPTAYKKKPKKTCEYMCSEGFTRYGSRCIKTPVCGDGILDRGIPGSHAAEQCDPGKEGGAFRKDQGCSTSCQFAEVSLSCDLPNLLPEEYAWVTADDGATPLPIYRATCAKWEAETSEEKDGALVVTEPGKCVGYDKKVTTSYADTPTGECEFTCANGGKWDGERCHFPPFCDPIKEKQTPVGQTFFGKAGTVCEGKKEKGFTLKDAFNNIEPGSGSAVKSTAETTPDRTATLQSDGLSLPEHLVGTEDTLRGDEGDLTAFLQKIAKGLAGVVSAIAILLIVQNSFSLVLGAGDSDQISKSKSAYTWIAMGLFLVIFAYIFVKTVISIPYSGELDPPTHAVGVSSDDEETKEAGAGETKGEEGSKKKEGKSGDEAGDSEKDDTGFGGPGSAPEDPDEDTGALPAGITILTKFAASPTAPTLAAKTQALPNSTKPQLAALAKNEAEWIIGHLSGESATNPVIRALTAAVVKKTKPEIQVVTIEEAIIDEPNPDNPTTSTQLTAVFYTKHEGATQVSDPITVTGQFPEEAAIRLGQVFVAEHYPYELIDIEDNAYTEPELKNFIDTPITDQHKALVLKDKKVKTEIIFTAPLKSTDDKLKFLYHGFCTIDGRNVPWKATAENMESQADAEKAIKKAMKKTCKEVVGEKEPPAPPSDAIKIDVEPLQELAVLEAQWRLRNAEKAASMDKAVLDSFTDIQVTIDPMIEPDARGFFTLQTTAITSGGPDIPQEIKATAGNNFYEKAAYDIGAQIAEHIAKKTKSKGAGEFGKLYTRESLTKINPSGVERIVMTNPIDDDRNTFYEEDDTFANLQTLCVFKEGSTIIRQVPRIGTGFDRTSKDQARNDASGKATEACEKLLVDASTEKPQLHIIDVTHEPGGTTKITGSCYLPIAKTTTGPSPSEVTGKADKSFQTSYDNALKAFRQKCMGLQNFPKDEIKDDKEISKIKVELNLASTPDGEDIPSVVHPSANEAKELTYSDGALRDGNLARESVENKLREIVLVIHRRLPDAKALGKTTEVSFYEKQIEQFNKDYPDLKKLLAPYWNQIIFLRKGLSQKNLEEKIYLPLLQTVIKRYQDLKTLIPKAKAGTLTEEELLEFELIVLEEKADSKGTYIKAKCAISGITLEDKQPVGRLTKKSLAEKCRRSIKHDKAKPFDPEGPLPGVSHELSGKLVFFDAPATYAKTIQEFEANLQEAEKAGTKPPEITKKNYRTHVWDKIVGLRRILDEHYEGIPEDEAKTLKAYVQKLESGPKLSEGTRKKMEKAVRDAEARYKDWGIRIDKIHGITTSGETIAPEEITYEKAKAAFEAKDFAKAKSLFAKISNKLYKPKGSSGLQVKAYDYLIDHGQGLLALEQGNIVNAKTFLNRNIALYSSFAAPPAQVTAAHNTAQAKLKEIADAAAAQEKIIQEKTALIEKFLDTNTEMRDKDGKLFDGSFKWKGLKSRTFSVLHFNPKKLFKSDILVSGVEIEDSQKAIQQEILTRAQKLHAARITK